jgi:hypothetical protein
MSDFKNFMQKGKSYSEFLRNTKPDIVERLNLEIIEEKERERTRKEEERKKDIEGDWNFNAESGEYYWTGENEPEYGDTFSCSPLTEEEEKLRKTAESREYEWFLESKKKDLTEKRKQKERENKPTHNLLQIITKSC